MSRAAIVNARKGTAEERNKTMSNRSRMQRVSFWNGSGWSGFRGEYLSRWQDDYGRDFWEKYRLPDGKVIVLAQANDTGNLGEVFYRGKSMSDSWVEKYDVDDEYEEYDEHEDDEDY
ncbi:hypothetical protein [Acidiphilium acidophilum]|uniref:hypothetical protein n=1 Tax=Acidiphilium acidophilum TaxID=76588 RepID=UPI002E8E740C|nr:hypothetical protein [Acidiphilium acidophilum]